LQEAEIAAPPAARSPLPDLRPSSGRSASEVLRIAHQGGFDGQRPYGPDNLRRLAALGTHLLEFDVRTTAHDDLIVAHDATIPSDGGPPLRIAEMPVDDLMAALPPDAGLPSVAEVVADSARAGLSLYVDIKDLTSAGAARLVQHLYDTGMVERAILASARPAIVKLCATVAPGLPRAILFSATDVDPVALAEAAAADFVHPCWERLAAPHKLLAAEGWLDRVRRHGLGVISWHEERRRVVEALYTLGIDGVCSDQPKLLSSVAADAPD
jgi:glycerophosphoryl diester phosphodiesterase